uniref:Si:ch211-93n23.7 n=1 Tax=Myripristis murdjan TaxID=586833 RepID=A0A668ANE1_9TELE
MELSSSLLLLNVRPDTDEVTRSLGPPSSHFFQDTPVPGHYRIQDFTEEAELNPVKKTYGFKSPGRSVPVWGTHKGDLLLPGAYDYPDSTREVLKRRASYAFKTCPRPDIVTLGVRDKDVNTSPCDYNVTAAPVEKIPSQREGPAPCHYSPQTPPAEGVTSCFRSALPRLHWARSTTPGPGAYGPSWTPGDRLRPEDVAGPSYSLFFPDIRFP